MAQDIFGYNKNEQPGAVLSFQDVVLSLDGNQLYLVQSAQLNYQRQITPITAVGTSTIYLSPQPGQGTLQITRAIGGNSGNMSTAFKYSDPCKVSSFAVRKTGNNGCTGVPDASVTGEGMVSSYGFNLSVGGGVTVTDSIGLTVTNVST